MVHIRELTLAALLLTSPASALYSSSGPVQLLDPKSFDKEILQSDHAAVVEFFAPWCGHCKNLAPQYERVGKNLKGIATVAAVDCDVETNKALCGSHGIQGFPTLKIFSPTNKKGKPIVEDYQGPRTAKAIVDAVVERIPNHVIRLTSHKVNDWLVKNNDTTKAVLFSEKGTTSALYRALAIEFLGRAQFAQVRDKEEDAVKLFGVTKYPTLIVLPGGEAPGKVYEGGMKIDALKEFMDSIVPVMPKKQGTKKVEKETVREDTPLPQDTPKRIPAIPELVDEESLSEACFGPKSKTCVLAIVAPSPGDPAEDPALIGLNAVSEKVSSTTKTFKFYRVSSESTHSKALVEALNLLNETPSVVAVNGHRRWYRVFSATPDIPSLLAWLDAITMGDVKKHKLPKEFMHTSIKKEKSKTMDIPPVEPPVEEATGDESVVEVVESETAVKEKEKHDEL